MPCFVVKAGRPKKDGTRGRWSVYYETNVDKTRHEACLSSVEKNKWGFLPDWSLEKAREHAHQLNLGNHAEMWNQRRYREEQRLREEDEELAKHFLASDLSKFESLLKRESFVKGEVITHWRYAKRLIVKLGLNAFTWSNAINSEQVYSYFQEKKASLSYTQKVLRAMNLWGEFLAEQRNQFYKPLKMPKGYQRQRIRDAHMKSGKKSNESLPLTPELLQKAQQKMREDHSNWMYLSLWLGLRPEELDSLSESNAEGRVFRIERTPEGTIILVYQSKLVGIEEEKRWKPIPLLEPEQRRCETLLRSGNFKRPLTKTIHAAIGEGYGCYAGRKGFQDLMLSRSWRLEDISVWMGHQSIETTWRYYKNKQKFTWKKAG